MTRDTGEPTTERRSGIQSIEIGMRLLEALASFGAASSLTSIAQACGMAAPQAHRYLKSLIVAGMAGQNAETGLYDLGPAALKVGLAALARTDAFSIIDRVMGGFATRSGSTVQIAALGPMGPTIVRLYMGRPPILMSLNVGSVLPLLNSATGRIFLGFVPENETAELVAWELPDSGMNASDVDVLRGAIRRAGVARETGMFIPGLNATACPIFDLQGRAILAAVGLSSAARAGPAVDRSSEELQALCREISKELGWSDPG